MLQVPSATAAGDIQYTQGGWSQCLFILHPEDQKLRSLSPTTCLTTWPAHNSAFWSDWGCCPLLHELTQETWPVVAGGGGRNVDGGAKSKGLRTLHLHVTGGGDTFKTQIPNSLSPSPLRTGTEGQLRDCWDLSFLNLPPALGLHPSFFSWGPAAALEEAGILQIKYQGTCLLPLLGRKRSEF